MLLVCSRGQGQVARCGHGQVAGGCNLAGDSADIPRGNKLEVATRFNDRAILGDALATRQCAGNLAVALFCGNKVDVTTCLDGGVCTAFDYATNTVGVAARVQRQVVRRFNASGAVHEVGAFAAIAVAAVMTDNGALIE